MTEFAGSQYLIEVIYLIASALFILSLKWMSSPATARHGILAGEIGMVLAIGGTLLHHGIVDYKWIIIALVLGSGIGIPLGMVQMTAVPQRTALSHAFGARPELPASYFRRIVTPPTAADTSAPTLGPLSCRITPLPFCNCTPPAPPTMAPPAPSVA